MQLEHFRPGTRPYLELEFPPPPSERPYVLINMVSSLDGKAVIETSEQDLGSPADQDRMQELRAHADAVLNGTGTMRESGASSRLRDPELVTWRRAHGKDTDHPLGVLITRTGSFPLVGDYFDGSGLEAVIFATEMPDARRAKIEAHGPRVVPVPGGESAVATMLRHLRIERDVRLLLCEGGPTINAGLLHLGAVDEFFLTLGPTLVGGRDTLTILEGPEPYTKQTVPRAQLRAVIANEETSELYLRYVIGNRE